MEFNYPTALERRAARHNRITQWRKWFAWRPVRVDDHTLVWWEWVERREMLGKIYRTPSKGDPSPDYAGRRGFYYSEYRRIKEITNESNGT